jgi:hypothetical protein
MRYARVSEDTQNSSETAIPEESPANGETLEEASRKQAEKKMTAQRKLGKRK